MNALERANLLFDLEQTIGRGRAETLENLIESMGYDLEKLDPYTKRAIDMLFFTCDQCNHTLCSADLSETEAGDGFLCKECANESQ